MLDGIDRAAVAIADQASQGAVVSAPEKERRCPDCNGVLERACMASTIVDVCAEHGTWFDRNELQRVAKVVERAIQRANERVKPASSAPRPPPPTPPLWDGIGWWSYLFELLGNAFEEPGRR